MRRRGPREGRSEEAGALSPWLSCVLLKPNCVNSVQVIQCLSRPASRASSAAAGARCGRQPRGSGCLISSHQVDYQGWIGSSRAPHCRRQPGAG